MRKYSGGQEFGEKVLELKIAELENHVDSIISNFMLISSKIIVLSVPPEESIL